MKVRIAVTVDVDPEAWAEEYGIESSGVREDLKTWVVNAIQQCPAAHAIRSVG